MFVEVSRHALNQYITVINCSSNSESQLFSFFETRHNYFATEYIQTNKQTTIH
jgi:hypothetical protein